MTLFTRAQRTQAKLRLAIDGPSGSGKTYSALLIAKGLAGGDLSKVALIDTERGSGSLYSDLGAYAILDFEPPYSVKRFLTAHQAAVEEGFEVIVIDSLTHFWSGEGGILDYVDKVAKASSSGNSFAAWKQGTPLQKQLMDAMLSSPRHIIATIRSKTEWVLEENEKGKKIPRKIGLQPEQRKDIDYEFTLVFDLSRDHIATASKDRTSLFDERLEIPSEKMGAELAAWLGSAAPEPPKPAPAAVSAVQDEQREQAAKKPAGGNGNGTITRNQAERLRAIIAAKGRTDSGVLETLQAKGIGDGTHFSTIPTAELAHIEEVLSGLPDPEPPTAPQEAESAVPTTAEAPTTTEPEVDEDFEEFDTELTKAAQAKPESDKAHRKPTVTPQQLTRLGSLCASIESKGVGEQEWRTYMETDEGVRSRKLLTKTAATRMIDRLNRWNVDLQTGVVGATEGTAA